ncbi:MAG: tetratricopeptide repeat protein [Magnetococcales bacterium]|nr:tetratricopeptide repeat protein [Magnetococcales bacterium]
MKNLQKTVMITMALTVAMVVGAESVSATENAKKPAVSKKVTKPLTPWAQSYKYEEEKKYEKAINVIKPYLKKREDVELANMRVAWLEYLQGNYNAAIKGYEKALNINPDSIEAKLGLSLPLMAQKRYREVRRHLNKIIKKSPWNYTAHQRLLAIDEIQGKWKHLTKHAKAVSKRFPSDTATLVYVARGYARQKNKTMAKNVYSRVLLRVPRHNEATNYIKNNK